jgi:hypothetical protein
LVFQRACGTPQSCIGPPTLTHEQFATPTSTLKKDFFSPADETNLQTMVADNISRSNNTPCYNNIRSIFISIVLFMFSKTYNNNLCLFVKKTNWISTFVACGGCDPVM